MKLLIVLSALFAVALAAPVEPNHGAEIIHMEQNVEPESYSYLLDISDGTHKEEEGKLKDAGTDHETIVVHGSYSWIDPKSNEKFLVTYVADENGYQPSASHLPK